MRRVTTLLLVLALLALPLGPHAAGAGGAPGWQRGVSDLIGGGPLWGTLGPDGRIYVFGLQLEAYDLHRRAWTLISAKPTAHSGKALVAAGTRVHALCGDANPPGLNTPDLRALNVAAAYAPATNRWAPIAPSLDPHLECAAARGQDGRLYVFGGGDEASFTSITPEVYDPRANTWTYITPPGESASSRQALVAHGGSCGHRA